MEPLKLLEHPTPDLISRVKDSIRSQPALADHRITLAHLLFLSANYEAGLKQCQVAVQLDASHTVSAQLARLLVIAERTREAVFGGQRAPAVLGESPAWVGHLVEALATDGESATGLRAQALDAAPPSSGQAGDMNFDWLMDGDERLGPVFEVVIGGEYHWVPICALAEVQMEPPMQLIDLVWAPVRIVTVDGHQHLGFMPARYPVGADAPADDGLLRGGRTEWLQGPGESWHGAGRRVWFTSGDELPMFGAATIRFDPV